MGAEGGEGDFAVFLAVAPEFFFKILHVFEGSRVFQKRVPTALPTGERLEGTEEKEETDEDGTHRTPEYLDLDDDHGGDDDDEHRFACRHGDPGKFSDPPAGVYAFVNRLLELRVLGRNSNGGLW